NEATVVRQHGVEGSSLFPVAREADARGVMGDTIADEDVGAVGIARDEVASDTRERDEAPVGRQAGWARCPIAGRAIASAAGEDDVTAGELAREHVADVVGVTSNQVVRIARERHDAPVRRQRGGTRGSVALGTIAGTADIDGLPRS